MSNHGHWKIAAVLGNVLLLLTAFPNFLNAATPRGGWPTLFPEVIPNEAAPPFAVFEEWTINGHR